jgi:hypothetical protein
MIILVISDYPEAVQRHPLALFVAHLLEDVQGLLQASASESGVFHLAVPWQSGTERVVIKDEGIILNVTHHSASPPEFKLIQPNGGEAWLADGEYEVAWTGSDPDGDPLRYVLQHSADGGRTWKALATNLVGQTYTLDATRLAGSEMVRLRILASDGVNTSHDESDGVFAVEAKSPEAMITSPVPGRVFEPGELVLMEGAATDLEDGPINDDSRFTWFSSVQGELGLGQQLWVTGLERGWHTITLRVTDSDGFTSESTATILVGVRLRLPLILNAP